MISARRSRGWGQGERMREPGQRGNNKINCEVRLDDIDFYFVLFSEWSTHELQKTQPLL